MKYHRNSQKRFYTQGVPIFLTSNVRNWIPYFSEPIFADLFVENLKLCKKIKQFELYGWSLAYDHFHLLILPSEQFSHSKVMQFLKRHTTQNINIITGYQKTYHHKPGGAIGQSRLLKRFDSFVIRQQIKFLLKYNKNNPFPKFKWHKSFFDQGIRGHHDFETHMNYLEGQIDKHNLPRNWPYAYINYQ